MILSGGLDSTVSSYLAKKKTRPVLALTFDYGQRAARREIKASREIARRLNVAHRVIQIPWLAPITRTALVNKHRPLPSPSLGELASRKQSLKNARRVWVPNRNGIFLNIGAAFAEALGAGLLVTGFNAEEAATFPDNGPSFVRAADVFFHCSTLNGVKVTSPTLHMNKREIVAKGKKLNIPFEAIWYCYEGGKQNCGRCESCLRFRRAYENTLA